MAVISAQFTESGMIRAVFDFGGSKDVPNTEHDRDRWGITDWELEDNTIAPYVAPPPPTDTERIDSAFPQSDAGRVIFEALFELINRVIALESGTAVTRAQLKTWLGNKLPGGG